MNGLIIQSDRSIQFILARLFPFGLRAWLKPVNGVGDVTRSWWDHLAASAPIGATDAYEA